jgi:hypothetical protein
LAWARGKAVHHDAGECNFSPSLRAVCARRRRRQPALACGTGHIRRRVRRGQGALSGRIISIGHLGWVSEADIDTALDALCKVISGTLLLWDELAESACKVVVGDKQHGLNPLLADDLVSVLYHPAPSLPGSTEYC